MSEQEIENIEIHDVYEYVSDIGQKYISTREGITEKSKDNKKIMKACLVTHGYEEHLHNLKRFSNIQTQSYASCNINSLC